MTTINQILNEDKGHDNLSCRKIIGRRLYLRDHTVGLHLGFPKPELMDKVIRKQRFRPIGIICLGCAYVKLSTHMLYTLRRMNFHDYITKDNEKLKQGKPPIPRQMSRRYEREDKRRDKHLEKLKINFPSIVKIEDS